LSFFNTRFVYLTITFVLFEIISRLFLEDVNIFIRYGLFLLLALLIDYLFRLFDQYPNKRN
jgi:hypothetical protein